MKVDDAMVCVLGAAARGKRDALVARLETRHGLKVGAVPYGGNMAEVEHAVLAQMRAQVCSRVSTK